MLDTNFEEQLTGQKGFHFIAAADLCSEPKPTEWLIKNYLEKNSLVDGFGESGSMKTFAFMGMGLSVAADIPWQGNDVKITGPVFYLCGEGFAGMRARLKAWEQFNEIPLDAVPFYVSSRPARFLDPEGVNEVIEAIELLVKENGQPVLIIVDTLNRNFGPGDENSTSDMTRFIQAMDDIRLKYQACVATIHHSGLNATDRARGASALRAALDWEYRMSKNSAGLYSLECTKCKDHPEPLPINFRPEIIKLDGWQDEDGEQMTSCVLVRTDEVFTESRPLRGARKIVFDVLNNIGNGKPVHINDWRDAAFKAGITASSEYTAKYRAFTRAVISLVAEGLVDTKDDYYWKYTRHEQT